MLEFEADDFIGFRSLQIRWVALYRAHTGLQQRLLGSAREAWRVVGRRGGTSRVGLQRAWSTATDISAASKSS